MANLPQGDTSRMEFRWLMRKSVWCGTVFGLAVILTSLNALPPISVSYRVQSDVVLSEPRLEALKSELNRNEHSRDLATVDKSHAVLNNVAELIGVQEIDRSNSRNRAADANGIVVTLVAIESMWRSKFDPVTHDDWVKSLSTPQSQSVIDSDLAKEKRIAKWEVEATQHYVNHQNFLSRANSTSESLAGNRANFAESGLATEPSDVTVFELASTKRAASDSTSSTPTQFATTQSNLVDEASSRSFETMASNQMVANEFEPLLGLPSNTSSRASDIDLLATLDAAKKRLMEHERAIDQQNSLSTGPIQFTDHRVVQSVASTIPVWMASSILILGIASGLCAGWFQHRLQSGGAFEPQFVADRLAFDGIPISGEVTIVEDSLTESAWLEHAARRANAMGRRAAVNLTRLSEWTLGFWVVLMAIRLLTDPMWRSVLADSPLAAFGRILVGMP